MLLWIMCFDCSDCWVMGDTRHPVMNAYEFLRTMPELIPAWLSGHHPGPALNHEAFLRARLVYCPAPSCELAVGGTGCRGAGVFVKPGHPG